MFDFLNKLMDWIVIIGDKWGRFCESISDIPEKYEKRLIYRPKVNPSIKEYCSKGIHLMFRINRSCLCQCQDCGYIESRCSGDCRGLEKLLRKTEEPRGEL